MGILAMVLVFCGYALQSRGQDTLHLTVEAGELDRTNAVVATDIRIPQQVQNAKSVTLKAANGETIEAQISDPGSHIMLEGKTEKTIREVQFILGDLKKGETLTLQSTSWNEQVSETVEGRFHWTKDEGKSIELRYGDKSVFRYMHEALDESSPQRREETYKVYHHLFDPAGQIIITKGPGGKYTHHRGLFYGFNKVTYGNGKECDVWHCKGYAHQSDIANYGQAAGSVMARHNATIDWHGAEGETFAREIRELTAWKFPAATLLEFNSMLMAIIRPLHLDGDPQHAGFHFRASNEVAESTAKETYYLRPDGKGGPGETRNWPDQKTHVNLPWDAMSFVVGSKRYTALYMDHPKNPKEARFSERDYGRFGSYFVYDFGHDSGLFVRYRLWLQEGEMTVEQANALSADFVNPVKVMAEWK